jgi:glucose-1-phosphate cytidylyltransferase
MASKDTPAEDIPVVILAGGMGTRMREATESLPKPMVDIGGKPILWHIMKLYSHYGHRRFIICLGYKGWQIKEYFLRYREHLSDLTVEVGDSHGVTIHNKPAEENWKVTLAETGLTSGTGARLRLVRDYIDTDTFMYTYGDGIGSVDIASLLECHRSHDRIGTVTGVPPTSRYGEMRIEGGAVAEFDEKPTRPPGFVNGGFFTFQREFLDYLDDTPELMCERGPLQSLARDEQLAVFRHDGFWMGMDTYREYTELNALWVNDEAPWHVWDKD